MIDSIQTSELSRELLNNSFKLSFSRIEELHWQIQIELVFLESHTSILSSKSLVGTYITYIGEIINLAIKNLIL